MNPGLFDELRKIRNQVAHRTEQFDSSTLSARLTELGLSIPPGDLPKLIPLLLQAFDRYTGFNRVPPTVTHFLGKMLDGYRSKVICDPWAGIGELLAAVYEAIKPEKAYAFTQNESEFR